LIAIQARMRGAPVRRSDAITSARNSATANPASSHTRRVGVPACSAAMVRAPKATNSPCGMNNTRVTVKTNKMDNANSAYTAPLVIPSCPNIKAICAFMQGLSVVARAGLSLLYERPLAVFDRDQFAAAIVESTMVRGAHVVDALGADQLFGLLQRIAQCVAKLLGARFAGFGRDRDGLLKQQSGVVDVGAEGGRS